MKKPLYEGWLTLYAEEVAGRTYELLKAPDAVAAWLEDPAGRLLLVEQYRPAVGRKTWELPAGVLDKADKSPLETLVEEIWEECEIKVEGKDLSYLLSYRPQMGHNMSTMALYGGRIKTRPLREKEVGDVDVDRIRWWTKEEVEAAISQGKLVDCKTLMAYYYMESQNPLNKPVK